MSPGAPEAEALGLVLGLAAYVGSNLGMGLQKQGVESLASLLRGGRGALRWARLRRLGPWLAGTLLTVGGSVLLFVALGLGRASVVGALEGVGLVALAVFARVRLGERLGSRGLVGVGAIVLGTALVATAAGPAGARASAGALALGLTTGELLLVGLVVVARHSSRWKGVAHGALAGGTAGIAMVIQKLVGEDVLTIGALDATTALLGLGWLGIAALGFVFTQLAWLRGRALTVAPAFAALSVSVPVVVGWGLLGEPVSPAGVVGVLLVLGGIVPVASDGAVVGMLEPERRP